jgi:hypothetical protein
MASDHDETDEDDYQVGYCRPPLHTRWAPGHSGNRGGRPKGAKGHAAILMRVANEVRPYKEGNRSAKATTLKLVLLSVRNTAAKGDLRALALLQDLLGSLPSDEEPVARGVLIMSEDLTQEEWDERHGWRARGDEASNDAALKQRS